LPHETGTVRLVAGPVGDVTGPVRTSGDPFVVQASLTSGSTLLVDVSNPCELALYVMTGAIAIAGEAVEPGQLARLTSGDTLRVVVKENSELLLVGGDPLDAPIMRHGPFVMNTIAELELAIRDYHAGQMGKI
jgi:redox-sensitive bicupin YhaK (pirin superfamily)